MTSEGGGESGGTGGAGATGGKLEVDALTAGVEETVSNCLTLARSSSTSSFNSLMSLAFVSSLTTALF